MNRWVDALRGFVGFFVYDDWKLPFNGQQFRQLIFFELLYRLPITAIVETGTNYGITTALMAATKLPVYSSESSPNFYANARMRFLFKGENVHLYLRDSRLFLRELSADNSVPDKDVFFYLDAHWYEDLPLREELEIIFQNWQRPVVMIDDFQVPGSDYGYDDYGPDKAINYQYIRPVATAHNISVYYPAVGADLETGRKRGCAVLCTEEYRDRMSKKVKTLVAAPH